MLCLTVAPREYIDVGEHTRLRFVEFKGEAIVVALSDRRNGVETTQTIALRTATDLRRHENVRVFAMRSDRGQVCIGFDAPRSVEIHRQSGGVKRSPYLRQGATL